MFVHRDFFWAEEFLEKSKLYKVLFKSAKALSFSFMNFFILGSKKNIIWNFIDELLVVAENVTFLGHPPKTHNAMGQNLYEAAFAFWI